MSDVVVTAIISGLCVAIPSVIATMSSNNKSNALMNYRIDELTKEVEKHNSVVERMAVVENSLKSAHHRIDELKVMSLEPTFK